MSDPETPQTAPLSTLTVGDQAPNFDLSSTEDVLLMLCDEVPRTAVLLYFFSSPDAEETRQDLAALAESTAGLLAKGTKVMGVSRAKLDQLKTTQRELGLPFPLLHDDREFSADYGVDSESTGLVLVGRAQQVLWQAVPCAGVGSHLDQLGPELKKLARSTANYPRKVINRLVDRWVN